MSKKTLEERFYAKVSVNKETGCWEWIAGKSYGYGVFHIKRGKGNYSSERAHRVSYQMHNGQIPEGMEICHKCDNPSCVNPNHLFAGTALDNAKDRDAKGRHYAPKGESSPHATITWEIVNKIRSEFVPAWGEQTRLAKKYGLTPHHVQKIVHNIIWR